MSVRINAGYIITDSIHVGDAEFVLGVNATVGAMFVTWECKDGNNYFWGHYTDDQFKAQKDLCERAMQEVKILDNRQKSQQKRNTPKNKDYER